jgi:hypothetical protein
MADASGYNIRAAVRRAGESTDYGDEVSGTTRQIPIMSESMTNVPTFEREEALIGQAGVSNSELVAFDPAGGISTELWYEGLEYLWFAGMGFENPTVYSGGDFGSGSGGSPAPDTASSPDAYVHVYELDENLHREVWLAGERDASSGSPVDPEYWLSSYQKVRCFDLGIDKKVPTPAVHAFRSCMVNGFTVNMTPAKCSVDWDLIARHHERDSQMNQSNWALPSVTSRSLFPALEARLSSATGGDEPTLINVSEVTIKVENNIQGDHAAQSASNDYYIIEPQRNGVRTVTGSIKLPRYDSDNYQTWMETPTDLQLLLRFTGPDISGSTLNHEYCFILPFVRITAAPFPVPGAGIITGDLEFEAMRPASEYTWVSNILGGIDLKKDNELIVVNTNTEPSCIARDNQDSGVTLP